MGENATAIKTIAVLVLLLLGLAAAAIFSYNPIPNIDLTKGDTLTPTSVPVASCENTDPALVASCCDAWASENQLNQRTCDGNWSWTQLGGCSYTCDTNN